MERYLKSYIIKDLSEKIILIMGARQSGKTTLAKSLSSHYDYYNYDALHDREALIEQSWDRSKALIIFDELHKMPQWKRWLKGVYDTQGIPPELVVTGSAKLNAFKKVGDSLAGRYFQFRLHPFDLKELVQFHKSSESELFEQFWQCSGFPEPFLKGTTTYYKRWRSTHVDMIIRQDLIDLYTVHDLKAIETLIVLLKSRVGSTVSYANLARDLQKDINTVKRWLLILEDLYVIYRVLPYSTKISRSLLKEPKFYFYDHSYVEDEGRRLENIVANALHKELNFIRDIYGEDTSLYFLRTKDGIEIDFLICINNKPTHMIEVKVSDVNIAKGFEHFSKFISNVEKIQVVKNLKRNKTFPTGVALKSVIAWLASLTLHKNV